MEWLSNTAVAVALQAPFLLVLGLHYDVLRRHSFALAGAYALALSLIVEAVRAGHSGVLAVAAAFIGVVLLLGLCEFALFRPMEKLGRSADELLIASLGANIVIVQALAAIFGDAVRFFPFMANQSDGFVRFANETPTLLALGAGAVAIALFSFFLFRTEIGARLMALGENELLLRSLGLKRTPLVAMLLAAIAAILTIAALAAVGLSGAFPNAGFSLVILGLVARLIGGPVNRPTFALAVLGVILLDQAAALVMPNQWRSMILFGVLLLVIVARTQRPVARAD